MKHLLKLLDLSKEEIIDILNLADDEGVHHVVAVADEAHLQAVERALIFADRHEVG